MKHSLQSSGKSCDEFKATIKEEDILWLLDVTIDSCQTWTVFWKLKRKGGIRLLYFTALTYYLNNRCQVKYQKGWNYG